MEHIETKDRSYSKLQFSYTCSIRVHSRDEISSKNRSRIFSSSMYGFVLGPSGYYSEMLKHRGVGIIRKRIWKKRLKWIFSINSIFRNLNTKITLNTCMTVKHPLENVWPNFCCIEYISGKYGGF